MKSFEVSIHLLESESLNMLGVHLYLFQNCLNVNLHRIKVLGFLIFIKLNLVTIYLCLAEVLGDLVLKTIKELRRDDAFFNTCLGNKSYENHQSFVKLSLATHNIQNLLHVGF